MSTQQQQQQQVSTTPMKGSRNPKRQQRRNNNTPASQGKIVMLTTPPSSPPRTNSPGDVFAEGTPGVFNGDYNNGSRKKNGTRSGKKPKENTRPVYTNGVSHHRHTSSQPSIASPPPLKDSPHYAGPTFHASPAPSALPIPTFFSKSVPDSGLSTSLDLENELDEESASELTPSKPKASAPRVNRVNHEPSPLDFLFKAAIDARGKSQQSPEVVAKSTVVPNSDSKLNLHPESSSNGIFSLELDNSEKSTPTYSTPVSSYKDKMNALTSGASRYNSQLEMDAIQRRVKTEELKHLLLNPRPQRPVSASPHPKAPTQGYFHNATPHVYNPNVPHHATSGPPTPVSFNGHGQQNGYYKSPPPQAAVQANSPAAFRRDFSPYASPVNPVRTNNYGPSSQSPFRGVPSSQRYQSPSSFNANLQHPPPPSRSAESDTKKMEDDLRRILKLDMTAGIQPNGVQSSMA